MARGVLFSGIGIFMSMNDEPEHDAANAPNLVRRILRFWSLSPVVATDVIAGRALLSVIGILTFLAALAAGAAQLVSHASSSWQASIISEVTIQVRPVKAQVIDEDLNAIAEFVRPLPGVTSVKVYTRDDSARLLQPWLGDHIKLDDLPIPRMIAIVIDREKTPDIDAIRAELAKSHPNAILDDHRGWLKRLALLSGIVAATASALMTLVIFATALAIAFATRGAMAGNRDIIEVLYFIGASDSYIAGEFQRHFVRLSLIGGFYGALSALIVLTAFKAYFAGMMGANLLASSSSLTIGWTAMAAMFGVVMLVTIVAAFVSRFIVHHTIGRLI